MSSVAAAFETPYESGAVGVTNGKLAMWLFLASEVMLFGALFSAYIVLRSTAPAWPRPDEVLSVPMATVNTIFLITSSMTMVLAFAGAQKGDDAAYRKFLWATVALSCCFLVVKSFEYGGKFQHGHFPHTSIFYAVYFTMTGLHCLHVIGGIGAMVYFLLWGQAGIPRELFVSRIECTGLYWHFVDLVWIFLFPSIYLL
ncbi:MAG: cytochrome c oxidase subunit 3 [Elusimicrobia bacterium]|nr:cytochrome c oxidase subunit 3 [Elusimicrobiota bacterium]